MGLLSGPFGASASTKFYDESTTLRIYDAVGDVQAFKTLTPEALDDTTLDATRYITTVVEDGTGDTVTSVSLTAGNALTVTTAANEYDGINLQARGEGFKLTVGMPLYFGAKLAIDDATQSDLLIGLAESKTDLMKTSVAHGVLATGVEGAFFVKVDGGTVLTGQTYEAGSQTNSATCATAMDTSAHIYEIVWDGVSQLNFYFDGAIIGTFTGTLPNGDLTPSLNFRAGSAVARVCEISWIRCFQARS